MNRSYAVMDQEVNARTGSRHIWIVAALMLGVLLSTLDTTIVSSAMPKIVSELHGLHFYSWAFTAYMLTSTVFLPLLGRMSDVYGRKRIYLSALLLFLVGSVMSGLADGMSMLVIGRAVQGLGGAGFAPVAMAIIGDLFSSEERRKIQSAFAGVFVLGTVSGSVLGGVITEYLSWHWVFWVNIPVGVIDLLLITWAFQEKKSLRPAQLDILGTSLLTFTLTAMMLTLVLGGDHYSWASRPVLSLATAALISFGLFLYVETRIADPMIPLQLFRERVFGSSILLIFLMGGALFGAVSFIPLFAQGVIGMSASAAGTLMTPGMLAMAVMSVVIGWAVAKYGTKIILVLSNMTLAVVFYMLSHLTPLTSIWHIVLCAVLLGMAFGSLQSALFNTVQDVIHPSMRGIGMSLAESSHVIGGTVGITLMNMVMNRGFEEQFQRMGMGSSVQAVRDVIKNPSLLMDASWRTHLSVESSHILQTSMSAAVNHAFYVSLVIVIVAAVGSFLVGSKSGYCQEHGILLSDEAVRTDHEVVEAHGQGTANQNL